MSNIGIIIEERAAEIGNFWVGRLLPFKQKKMVGPFVFIDHMGPAEMGPNDNLDVGPHPHIGLSTLTYLFEGRIAHKDSLGSDIEITPGAVNFMTSGKGVVHSERTPLSLRGKNKTLHGLQIWVALPKQFEAVAPSFEHYEAITIPKWMDNDVQYTLIAGTLGAYQSPVAVYSPLFLLEIKNTTSENKEIEIGAQLFGEAGMYILEGAVIVDNETYTDKKVLVAKEAKLCTFTMKPHTTVYLFGGDPFPEERFIFWNFVSSDKQVLNQAIEDWHHDKFPKIAGETDKVPLPEYYSRKWQK